LNNSVATSLLCAILAACGGGGGSGLVSASSASGQLPTSGAVTPAGTVGDSSTTGSGAAGTDTVTAAARASSGNATRQTAQADATRARFNRPLGIARDSSGNLYVADSMNYTVRKIAATGVVTTLAGTPGASGATDGNGAAARFTAPKGIAVDGAGNVYLVDGSAIRKITPTGAVSTLAGVATEWGDTDGPGATARFNRPYGIAVDAGGTLYVADTENRLVRKIAPNGQVSTVAGARNVRGTADGVGGAATFLGPRGIAVDSAGTLHVTDWYGPPAPMLRQTSTFVRRITPAGEVITVAGTYGSETGPALFSDTFAITADGAGNSYVASGRSVRRIGATGAVTTVATSTSAFDALQGIAIDPAGALFVTDTYAISKVTIAGGISLIAGNLTEGGSADTP
jgi:sugar lactone lactonase YvrE